MNDKKHTQRVINLAEVSRPLYVKLWGTVSEYLIQYNVTEEELLEVFRLLFDFQRSRI